MMEQQDKPMLIAYEGDQEGQRWILDDVPAVLGRSPGCDIVLSKRQVSRRHAQIERDDEGYLLRDLGSKNGTYVNGEQVRTGPHRLQDGDEIQVALYIKLGFVGADATLPLEMSGPYKGLHIDQAARRVFIGGQELMPPLSPAQYRLLELLFERDGELISRDEIVETVWSEEEARGVTEQAIDALVHRLRERLAAIDPDHDYIVTVRGHGYRLENR